MLAFSGVLRRGKVGNSTLVCETVTGSTAPGFVRTTVANGTARESGSGFFTRTLSVVRGSESVTRSRDVAELGISTRRESRRERSEGTTETSTEVLVNRCGRRGDSLRSREEALMDRVRTTRGQGSVTLGGGGFSSTHTVRRRVGELGRSVSKVSSQVGRGGSRSTSITRRSITDSSIGCGTNRCKGVSLPAGSSSSRPSAALLPRCGPGNSLIFGPGSRGRSLTRRETRNSACGRDSLRSVRSRSSVPRLGISNSSIMGPRSIISSVSETRLTCRGHVSKLEARVRRTMRGGSTVASPRRGSEVLGSTLGGFRTALVTRGSDPRGTLATTVRVTRSKAEIAGIKRKERIVRRMAKDKRIGRESIASPGGTGKTEILSSRSEVRLVRHVAGTISENSMSRTGEVLGSGRSEVSGAICSEVVEDVSPDCAPFSAPRLVIPSGKESSSAVSPSASARSSKGSCLSDLGREIGKGWWCRWLFIFCGGGLGLGRKLVGLYRCGGCRL